MNVPAAVAVVVTERPVTVSVAVTVAPAGAPLPWIVPTVCATAVGATKSDAIAADEMPSANA